MGILVALTTVLAIGVIGYGLRRLRSAMAAGSTGAGLAPAAVMVFSGVAAASIGFAVVPFTFSGHIGDGVAVAVAAGQLVILAGALLVGVMMAREGTPAESG